MGRTSRSLFRLHRAFSKVWWWWTRCSYIEWRREGTDFHWKFGWRMRWIIWKHWSNAVSDCEYPRYVTGAANFTSHWKWTSVRKGGFVIKHFVVSRCGLKQAHQMRSLGKRCMDSSLRSCCGVQYNIFQIKPVWIADEETMLCMLCCAKFTVFLRRHHCRCCGRVLCGPCSSQKVICVKSSEFVSMNGFLVTLIRSEKLESQT